MSMIELREYTKTDLNRLVQLANKKSVARYLVPTFPYPYTLNDAEWWIKTGSKENGSITKVIEYQGLFVGSVGTTPQTHWQSHIVEIGYWVGEEYWGRGIASEALRIMNHLVVSSGKYKKIFAPVFGANRASMRVLEKNNYILEGVLKQEVFKGEHYHDIYHYAKVCS